MRQHKRWVRCPCITRTLSAAFVHATLRAHDAEPLPAADLFPINATITEGGDWQAFRHTAWRSLLAYEPQGITHDVVFFHRLADIKTGAEQSDTQESTLRDLVQLDILIVVISAYDIANRLTRSVFGNLLDERTNLARGTWIFTHTTGASLRALLDEPIARRWFPLLTDAHTPAAPVRPAARGQRPRADAGDKLTYR